ncbi:hypothetical protein ACEK07_04960 [Alcanivoracaceae bacterium MT1]
MNIGSQESSRITFPDPDYAACGDTHLNILVYPDGYGMNEVTEALRLEPDRIQKKDDEIINSRTRERVVKKVIVDFSFSTSSCLEGFKGPFRLTP